MEKDFNFWQQKEEGALLETYSKFPLAFTEGKGVHVTDVTGTTFLDFYGGHAVALIGHCHPHLVKTVKAQLDRFIFYSNLSYLPIRAEAAEKLLDHLYGDMDKIFFINSGAEANEAALKMARHHTGRERIVAMQDGFHGRTVAALSVTGFDKFRHAFLPNLGGETDFIPFSDMDALKTINPQKTAAIIVEPIQSMAGAITATPEYFKALRNFASEHGILLIFDEIQTGFCRTGRPFAGMHWDVSPDIVTMGKGIAGGLPAAAVAVTEPIAKLIKPGDHGSTFGGGPIACAAIKATLEVLENENLAEHAASMGEYLFRKLIEVPAVSEVRGMGLLIGFTMDRPAAEVRRCLLERHILVGTSMDPSVVRLLPPLTITRQDCNTLISALKEISQ